jgi:hypothetical protein
MAKEMTLEEAKAYRASKYRPDVKPMDATACRQAFKLWWAQNKKAYGASRDLEAALWLHLVAIKKIQPSQFEAGVENFGLKK